MSIAKALDAAKREKRVRAADHAKAAAKAARVAQDTLNNEEKTMSAAKAVKAVAATPTSDKAGAFAAAEKAAAAAAKAAAEKAAAATPKGKAAQAAAAKAALDAQIAADKAKAAARKATGYHCTVCKASLPSKATQNGICSECMKKAPKAGEATKTDFSKKSAVGAAAKNSAEPKFRAVLKDTIDIAGAQVGVLVHPYSSGRRNGFRPFIKISIGGFTYEKVVMSPQLGETREAARELALQGRELLRASGGPLPIPGLVSAAKMSATNAA